MGAINPPQARSYLNWGGRFRTYDASMSPPDGNPSLRECGHSRRAVGEEIEDDALHSALRRLSLNLDRIYALLEELHAATRSRADSSCEPEDVPRVVYGGGPSAFTSR